MARNSLGVILRRHSTWKRNRVSWLPPEVNWNVVGFFLDLVGRIDLRIIADVVVAARTPHPAVLIQILWNQQIITACAGWIRIGQWNLIDERNRTWIQTGGVIKIHVCA